MTSLLDVNVLIALADRHHENHDVAHRWLGRNGANGWASCAITENGLVRIVSNPRYPNSTKSPALVIQMLAMLRQMSGHVFWNDCISLLDDSIFRTDEMISHKQVTDIYLLGLARSYRGYFATFDRHIRAQAVIGGRDALHIIEI
ncbi:TA system VapC family ribonuclease toxin [Neorhizobium sp. JUb45]|uniref:TA system VapC family ribonuclease toxin n=1 Tax=unclassified Neorhizobium TaxID=2629175 RepID=UPI001043D140|nr:TA system VapC family ribonuclease toxin [Neorhizobium sp. JUb45]TCR04863.1 hypothetical protein EDF70_102975 [Neorhizobium sp. JUb45]